MPEDLKNKSTIEDIRRRFDADVERFSNLETGQTSTIDAPLAMELITSAAIETTKPIEKILDIGCGAGNNTISLSMRLTNPDCDLLDLSQNMLNRAVSRISQFTKGKVSAICSDFRDAKLEESHYDVVLAAAVLHHLRDDDDWLFAFQKIYSILKPNGSIWITDLVSQENESVNKMMWERYGKYLSDLGGEAYRDKVFAYVKKEDSPRPLTYQLDLLKKVGFRQTEILHKNSCFAAFGAIK